MKPSAKPFLSPEINDDDTKCFICWKNAKEKDKQTSCVGKEGIKKFTEQAELWSQIAIPAEVKEHNYTLVFKRLHELGKDSKILVHLSCRTSFKSKDVLDLFLYNIKTKIVRDKEAYLLHELLNDVRCISEDHELEPPAIDNTKELKRFIIKHFEDKINFFPSGKYLLVHPIDINPCSYSIATIKGRGLRDADLAKAFGCMIRRKLDERKNEAERWPLTPDELLSKLDSGPLPDLYNTIYYSVHDRGKLNEYGYIETSQTEARKIWSIASDWESLVTRKRNPKQIILGLVLHRITGIFS